jgi:hypothetical protein
MATKLDKSLKRELDLNGEAWMLTIDPNGLKLVPKGKRNGHEVAWKDIISGSAALTSALGGSVDRAEAEPQ